MNTPHKTDALDTELEALFLPKIFYIGEQLPQTQDDKCKFVMLGTPKEFMDDIAQYIQTHYLPKQKVLEAIGDGSTDSVHNYDAHLERQIFRIELKQALGLKESE